MRISDWSSDVCSSDLETADLGADALVGDVGQGVAQRVVEEPLTRGEQQVAHVEGVSGLRVVDEPVSTRARQVELGVPGSDRHGRAAERCGHRRPPSGRFVRTRTTYPNDATQMHRSNVVYIGTASCRARECQYV